MDNILRLVTIFLFMIWSVYWFVMQKKTEKEKPKKSVPFSLLNKKHLRKLGIRCLELLLLLQLLGLSLSPMSYAFLIQITGVFLVIFGMSVAIIGRHELDTNWEHAFDFQVKQKQELITTGIYASIRHPIYAGLMLALIGGELVAQSYLFVFYCLLWIGAYKQAKLEEQLLMKHFGNVYRTYIKRTKMFFPFVW